jgi:hypothetical protein
MGMQAAGGILGAVGAIQAGNSAQRAAEQEADLLDYRATLAIEQGLFNAQAVRKQGVAVQGAQKVASAANGVVVGDGTSGQLLEQTAKLSEQDALQVKLNASREAWGLREQAKQTRYQGDMAKYKGRLDAIGAILGTGGNMAANYRGNATPEEGPTYESTGMSIFPMSKKPKAKPTQFNSAMVTPWGTVR